MTTSRSKERITMNSSLRREVLKSNGGKCVYCGDAADCIDHIRPYQFVLEHSRDNLVPACSGCNSCLGPKDYGSFEEKKRAALVRVERLKRDGLWYFHDQISLMLRALSIDQNDAAEKCGIDRMVFEEILGGHIEASDFQIKAIRAGLRLPGLGKPAHFFCAGIS